MPPLGPRWDPCPGRAGNEHLKLAFCITLLMSSSFPKLHTLETANVKFFFSPFLRKQPNPNPTMFAQPKGTSPLARQRRNAQMLCRPVKQEAQLCPPSHPNTNSSEAQTEPLRVLLAQAVTVTVLYLTSATPTPPAHACCSSGTEASGSPKHTALTSTDTPTAT